MMSDAFDDQYLGCAYQMEGEMEKVLDEELKYNQFYVMWSRATRAWASTKKDLNLPVSFKDQYGAAVVLYTMETPYPIYQQLNGNISIAGKSRDYYMDNFHFKALHFYLTRALQELSGGCTEGITTYRGVRVTLNVFPQLRFGQFASSSRNKDTAESFGKDTFFTISTCFGVDISALSQYEVEDEVLIPVAEKFYRMDQIIKTDEYTLRSSGEQCSYFNCAYLGGKYEVILMSAPLILSFFM
ncbi:hypothetical protein GDO81_022866 [Engystomops pustulosus]|uniref:NAD(P)(+)--arginine ADP-ribosyltransferase n=1 Tax=Engystomops pustulosus TaxID=76066 RepID=A0AAV6Z546_ENGPU|nr:hypothetical protein GDO81_022866 [Engystomops pustulosus]